ncbi:MAG TPA: ATP-binding protein [Allocoleopsis sp.]
MAEQLAYTEPEATQQQPEKFSIRSPETQAEVERINQIDTYVGMKRDVDLNDQLNYWRDLTLCGRITTLDRLGLSKAFQHYSREYVKRRGGLLQIPASVVSVEVEQYGSANNLFLLILKFFGNPYDFQKKLQVLRSQTWGTLKSARVRLLIINNADLLSLAALWELVRIFEELKISVVLAGFPDLDATLDPNNHKKQQARRIEIHNTFLEYHQFNFLSPGEVGTFIKEWEEQGLQWSTPLNLHINKDIISILHNHSKGQLKLLYENLRKIALWKLDNPRAQINSKNIDAILSKQREPIV